MINRIRQILLWAYLVIGIVTSIGVGAYLGAKHGAIELITGVAFSVSLFCAFAPLVAKIIGRK